jgi:hypothetical protein
MLRNCNLPAPPLRAAFYVSCRSLDNGAAAVLTSHSLSSTIYRSAPCLWNYALCLKTILVNSHAIHNRPASQGPACSGAMGGPNVQTVTTSLLAIADLQESRALDRHPGEQSLLLKVQQLAPKLNAQEIPYTLWRLGSWQARLALVILH